MKEIIASVLIALCLVGCVESTEYGVCVGLVEEEDPTLQYKISVNNTVWSFIFVETIIAPVLWATSYAKCPVARRTK